MTRASVTCAFACVACFVACKSPPDDDGASPASPVTTSTLDPNDAEADTAAATAAEAGPPLLPVANLTVVANHDDFRDAWLVGEALVLVGCHRLRVLTDDLQKGHDVAAAAVSDATAACANLVIGVSDSGHALVTFGSPLHAVDITTGAASVSKGSAPTPLYPSGFYTAVHGVVRFDAHRPSPTGYDSFAFAKSADAVYVFGHNGVLRAVDPESGDVRWEYGIGLQPSANRPPVLWKRKDDLVLVSPSKTPSGHDSILLFERTNTQETPWRGTVRGVVVDPKSSASAPPPDHYTVFVGDEVVSTGDGGSFTADASTRGLLRVSVADVAPGLEVVPQNLSPHADRDAGLYIVDLKIRHDERRSR